MTAVSHGNDEMITSTGWAKGMVLLVNSQKLRQSNNHTKQKAKVYYLLFLRVNLGLIYCDVAYF